MKESASNCINLFCRPMQRNMVLIRKIFIKKSVHVHVPCEGAVPKDGPSAGVTMLSSLTSAFSPEKS